MGKIDETMGSDRAAPREKMVVGAADMIRRRGLNATSVRELAKHTGTPLGSTYHYFPGGKEQLATEAVYWAGQELARLLAEHLARSPAEGLAAFLAMWRQTIVDTDFQAGCPMLAVSVEQQPDDGDSPALKAAADVFASWEKLLADALRDAGASRRDAAQLATLVVAAIEGAVVISRAKRSIAPLDDVAAQLTPLMHAAATGTARR